MNRKLIKDLMDAIKASDRKKTSGYDTSAVVRRIEDGTAWVHIPGGVDETPVKLTINASVGDTVQVRISGGRAFLVGNRTAPPTDDTTAIKATYVAKNAQETAVEAKSEASDAWHYAGTAKEAAESAQDSADSAAEAAIEAWNHADEAQQAAVSANNSANSALTQLSVVEDVAGTLNWIREHGSFVQTTDVTVQENTVYFELINGEYVPIVLPDSSKNPMEEGWYVLDVSDSQSEYIMAHLAVTSAGLWVLPYNQLAPHPLIDSEDNNLVDSDDNQLVDFSKDPQNASGYKVLLSNTGMTVYDDEGDAIANYGATTTIGHSAGYNVHITDQAVLMRSGDTVLAKYDGEGMSVYDENGEIASIVRETYTTPGYEGSSGKLKLKKYFNSASGTVYETTLDGYELDFADNGTSLNDVSSVRYTRWGIYYNGSGVPVGSIVYGELYQQIEPIYIQNGEYLTTHVLYLDPGNWLINFGGSFDTHATGDRIVVLNNSVDNTVASRQDLIVKSSASHPTIVNGTRIVHVSNPNTVFYLHVYQNAGSGNTIRVYPYMTAMKML